MYKSIARRGDEGLFRFGVNRGCGGGRGHSNGETAKVGKRVSQYIEHEYEKLNLFAFKSRDVVMGMRSLGAGEERLMSCERFRT